MMGGLAMDFIERLFGISPDGGDGSTELMYVVALITVLLALSFGIALKRSRFRPPSNKR
jgi:hypothetical protein